MSADLRCSGTPISWLRLEMHHAGELPAAERAAVTAHLATCAACAACLAKIEAEASFPLAPLAPVVARAPLAPPARPVSYLRRLSPPLAALAVAAGVLLLLGRGTHPDPQHAPHDREPGAARTKGGDVAFVLVRDDESLVAEAGGLYRDGDRWKAIVTCPAGMHASWDLAVFEHGEAEFPLVAPAELACGNGVPMAGAFRTIGHDRMTVCLVWSDGAPVDRESIRHATPDTLPHAACKVLAPTD